MSARRYNVWARMRSLDLLLLQVYTKPRDRLSFYYEALLKALQTLRFEEPTGNYPSKPNSR